MSFYPHHIEMRGPGFGYLYDSDESKRVGFSVGVGTDGSKGLHIWAARYYPHGDWEPSAADMGRAEAYMTQHEDRIVTMFRAEVELEQRRKEARARVETV
jgi:hypothetical protein